MPQTVAQPSSIEEVRVMTVKQVAEKLKVHRKTLWRWARLRNANTLRPIKQPRGAVRYLEAEVLDWIKRNRV